MLDKEEIQRAMRAAQGGVPLNAPEMTSTVLPDSERPGHKLAFPNVMMALVSQSAVEALRHALVKPIIDGVTDAVIARLKEYGIINVEKKDADSIKDRRD